MTRETESSFPGMGLAEMMTMSEGLMSSLRCSEKAMRVRPDICSPCEPVVMTTISSSG